MSKNKLKFDFYTIPTTATLYERGIAVKSFKIKDHINMINGIIDNTDGSVFEQIKLKKTIHNVLDIFDPKSITIVQKDNEDKP